MFQRKSDGLWVEEITVDGKRKRITAKSKSALNKKLRDQNIFSERGPLFSEVADKWEIEHSTSIEETTAGSYAAHIRRAKEFFEGDYINDITPSQCQAYIDDLVAKDYARDTVHRAKNVLEQIFSYAITLPGSTIRYNPVEAVKQPRGLKHRRREPPTKDQLVKVSADSEMGLFACFLLYTGLRRGELLALLWKDIDFDNKVIHVSKRAQYGANKATVKEGAKTDAGVRDVPLIDALDELLPRGGEGYVFGGDKPLTHTMFQKRWLSWCREVGLAEAEEIQIIGKNGRRYTRTKWKAQVTPHQFRHQFATMLYRADVSELDAKSTMGHSSIVITHDIYTHIMERDRKSEVTGKLNTYLRSVDQK